jgi:hypothetical protein
MKKPPEGGFLFRGQRTRSNGCHEGQGCEPDDQAAVAKALTLVDRRLLSRAALFLWKMPLSAMASTTACILPNNSVALVCRRQPRLSRRS